MTPFTELQNRLCWHRAQFARYALVFLHDDWLHTRAMDRLDIATNAVRKVDQVATVADVITLYGIATVNDETLEEFRAAIIRMPDDVWDAIVSELE